MRHSLKNLQDYAIRAVDGTAGHVVDLYFDDQTWIVRYFVVETGTWLAGRGDTPWRLTQLKPPIRLARTAR